MCSTLKESKLKDDTSSDSEEKMAVKSFSMPKRKGEMEGGEVVEKRRKGRPRKDNKMMMPMSQPFPQVTRHNPASLKALSANLAKDCCNWSSATNQNTPFRAA